MGYMREPAIMAMQLAQGDINGAAELLMEMKSQRVSPRASNHHGDDFKFIVDNWEEAKDPAKAGI